MLKIRFIDSGTIQKDVVNVELREQKESYLRESDGKKSLIVGIEKRDKINLRKAILIPRKIVSLARSMRLKRLSFNLRDLLILGRDTTEEDMAELISTNLEMANFEFTSYKSPPEEGFNFIEEIYIAGELKKTVKDAIMRGQLIGDGVNMARSLVNTPAGDLTPIIFVQKAAEILKGLPLVIRVLNKRDMERLKMGGILAVSKGSDNEPRFIVMEYRKGDKKPPIVLIGKGITFDSGGLNLKPSDAMADMHMDMSGASALLATIYLSAKLGLKKNIIGIIPLAENMPSGKSYHPGDIIRTMSGKTVEVLNTDAEGRLILADSITYGLRYRPRLLITIATLTGAAMVALGQRASAIFSSDDDIQKFALKVAEESGDYAWPLPLWEEYEEDIKGTYADLANTGKTRYGGAIVGATFLYQFIKESRTPFLHIDIAPRMTSIESEYLSKGSTGAPVRFLIRFLRYFEE